MYLIEEFLTSLFFSIFEHGILQAEDIPAQSLYFDYNSLYQTQQPPPGKSIGPFSFICFLSSFLLSDISN